MKEIGKIWLSAILILVFAITFTACGGGGGGGKSAAVNKVPEINGDPVAMATEDELYEDANITATDPEGNELTYELIGPAWLAADNTSGVLTGTPLNEHVGENSFTFTVTDTGGGEATLDFVITVANANDTPVATGDITGTVDEDSATGVEIVLSGTDVDDGETATLTFAMASSPTHGSGTISGNTLTYTPTEANFNGSDSFTFTVTDTSGAANDTSTAATVNITVNPINDTPVASPIPDQEVAEKTFPIAIDLSAYLTDMDTVDTLTYSVTSNSDSATVSHGITDSTLTLTRGAGTGNIVTLTVRLTDLEGAWVEDTFDVLLFPALYSNGVNWNEYVINDGANRYGASDIPCDGTETGGYDACIHGGEVRYFDTGLTDVCTDLTAADALGAFDWVCDDSGATTVFYSSSLAGDKNLSDLIDFTASPIDWKANQIVVTGGAGYTSSPAKWWANSIAEDNAGGSLATSGTVYVVTANPSAVYTIDANKVALVIKPGITLTGSAATAENLISADTQNFLWLEGALDGTGDFYGIHLNTAKFSVLRGINADNVSEAGIILEQASNNKLSGISATNNGTGAYTFAGIYLWKASNNTLSGIIANSNGTNGVYLSNSSSNNTLTGITANNNDDYGVYIYGGSNNTLSDISAANNLIAGVYVYGTSNNTLTGITATGNGNGVRLGYASSNTLSGITASNSVSKGIWLGSSSSNNTFTDINSINNAHYGVLLDSTSSDNTFTYISANNNGMDGVFLDSCSNNTFSGIKAANNTNSGVYLSSASFNTVSQLSAANNADYGIYLHSSEYNTLSHVNAANNADYGIYLYSSEYNTLSHVSAANNRRFGILIAEYSNNNTLFDISSANNGGVITGSGILLHNRSENNLLSRISVANNWNVGISISNYSHNTTVSDLSAANNTYGVGLSLTTNNAFSGLFKVGNNVTADCYVDAESYTGGLKDDSGGVDANHDGVCLQVAPSDFGTAITGVTLAGSFVGKVSVDDAANTSDTNGAATYPADPATFDWASFDNIYSGWGINGSAFPNADHLGNFGCSFTQDTNQTDCEANSGTWNGSGRIWDWSLVTGDTGDAGGPVILGVLALPTGDDTLTHTWTNSSTTTFLRNAEEMMGDGVGNDNLLCETNEECLYTPNIASYQGHGALVEETFSAGEITGVTLWKYETNGY